MAIKLFTLDVLTEYKLFYMLDFVDTSKDLTLKKLTPDGYIDVTYSDQMISPNKHAFFQMNNEHVLLAFVDPMRTQGNYNYVVSDGVTDEIVCTQSFERIWNYYDKPVDTDEGFFVFMNSIPINIQGMDWRCDNSAYGPFGYNVGKDLDEPVLKTLDQIRIYEPVLSLNSIGHLVYAHMNISEETTEYFINGNPIPLYSRTLSESLKQLVEWAEVTKEPFNNDQEMALDARQFLESYKFDKEIVSDQVDMQVFEYLKGNEDARVRPTDVQPTNELIKEFVKKRVCFSTLSALLTLYPDAWDIQEIIDKENVEFPEEINRFFRQYIFEDIKWTNKEFVLKYIQDYFTAPGLLEFIKLKYTFFENKKKLLETVTASPTKSF
jgi:hypothetical protein